MNQDQAAKLREPFGPESVGKLPRVFCKACRDHQFKTCDKHTKRKCQVCGNNITDAHLHLDYVGHAEITDRLLAVDPNWVWEPVAFGGDGLPQMGHGGLWIRLTIAGVTRLGFGAADGKTGPDAVKECIGDALRNAAMRFGVGLDLWGATYKEGDQNQHEAEPDPVDAKPEWDPIEQAAERDGWERDLNAAKNLDELGEVRARISNARKSGRLSPATLDHLSQTLAARRTEVTVEAKTDEPN